MAGELRGRDTVKRALVLLVVAWLGLGAARAEPLGESRTGAAAQGAVTGFAQGIGGVSQQDEFLHPDVAFVPDAMRDGGTLVVRWEIAEGYYLYRDKLSFELLEPEGAKLGAPQLPGGQFQTDEFFGRMEVYYQRVQATLPLQGAGPEGSPLRLRIGYQGCADAGLCYPPITKTLSLGGGGSAAGLGGTAAAGGPGAGALSEQDRIARALAGGAAWLALLTFFGFGLLLAFTPCVFPMIPILSGIIVGQGSALTTRRAFALSLVYVLAMATTYALAGVAAGLFGQNLQALLQAPWVLVVFSLVFVALAASMFGLYELQLPARWQTRLAQLSQRQRGGTALGVAGMGVVSALIVGPCVAPPLAGALIYIGHTGDAALGGTALFALALGMGTPLLLIGASAGRLLPRAGAWMERVRAVFGVLLLAVAVYLVERIVPAWVGMLLWAGLFLTAGVAMGVFDRFAPARGAPRYLWRAAGVLLVAYGAVVTVGAVGGGDDVLRPLAGARLGGGERAGTHAQPHFVPVDSAQGLRERLAAAAAQGRPVMVEYYADWCITCKELERHTFSDPRVGEVLQNALLLRVDVTAYDAADRVLLERFDLFGPPAVLFFGGDGEERRSYRLVGFMDAEAFRAHARAALG